MRGDSGGFWQSYADLAMGMMAVLALMLVLLLAQQYQKTQRVTDQKQQLLVDKAELEREKRELLEAQRRFGEQVKRLAGEMRRTLTRQEDAEEWLRRTFNEAGCLLDWTDRQTLEARGPDGTSSSAQLYRSGQVTLTAEGQQALESCRNSFVRLAYCLTRQDWLDGEGPEVEARRARYEARCAPVLEAMDGAAAAASERDAEVLEELRKGIEALVLEGNTDRVPPGDPSLKHPVEDSFIDNAELGARRATQALAHLVGLVSAHAEDDWDAMHVLMSRVRVESPSFGRYQAGPVERWDVACQAERAAAGGRGQSCGVARNLSLRIRWRDEALRRPADDMLREICGLLEDESSFMFKAAGPERDAWKRDLGCEESGG